MKTNSGFILFSYLLLFLVCITLLTATLLAHVRSLKLFQKQVLQERALTSAQLALECQKTALPVTITHHNSLKEARVSYNGQIIFNLISYQP